MIDQGVQGAEGYWGAQSAFESLTVENSWKERSLSPDTMSVAKEALPRHKPLLTLLPGELDAALFSSVLDVRGG